LSVVLLLLALAGVVGGAALISVPAVGAAIIFDSLCVGVWALLRDDGDRARPSVHEVPTLAQVLDRARAS
jgi:hypothetical protein